MRHLSVRGVIMDGKEVPFHFLLLGIGALIQIYGYATPEKLQTFVNEEPAFGYRPPLSQCALAFKEMEEFGFIVREGGSYTLNYMS